MVRQGRNRRERTAVATGVGEAEAATVAGVAVVVELERSRFSRSSPDLGEPGPILTSTRERRKGLRSYGIVAKRLRLRTEMPPATVAAIRRWHSRVTARPGDAYSEYVTTIGA